MICKLPLVALLATGCVMAQAQSSMTVYGRIDLRAAKDLGSAAKLIGNGSGSRLGFRGTEDLGGGMSAFFDLQHRVNADTGAVTNTQHFWQQSYVGLASPMGRVWMGRDYTPGYIQVFLMPDPFEHSNTGNLLTINTGGISKIRVDSGVNVQTKVGDVTATVQIAEASDTIDNFPDRPLSVALVYARPGLKVGYGFENPGPLNDRWQMLAASYDLAALNLRGSFGQGQTSAKQERKSFSLAATYAIGEHRLLATYGRLDNDTAGTTLSSKLGLGWVYFLSKRTNLYASIARDSKLATEASGYDLGIKHNF
jgi:predicted porin